MEKKVFLLIISMVILLLSFFSLHLAPSITGAHHTPSIVGRIIRDQSGKFYCNEQGAKELAEFIRYTQGCSRVNYCGQILYGWLPRRNKVTITGCESSEDWSLLLKACARNYRYLCETEK